jgi:hypothetical protein
MHYNLSNVLNQNIKPSIMKTKMNLLFIYLTVLTLTLGACGGSQDNKRVATDLDSTKNKSIEKVLYTCSMHPEVRSDKPGKCPKCGMELIKVEKPSDTTIVKN